MSNISEDSEEEVGNQYLDNDSINGLYTKAEEESEAAIEEDVFTDDQSLEKAKKLSLESEQKRKDDLRYDEEGAKKSSQSDLTPSNVDDNREKRKPSTSPARRSPIASLKATNQYYTIVWYRS